MIYIILIISFLLETVFSNLISLNSIFVPLFLLTSLVIIYPYFNNKKSNFIITCVFCGLLYDIAFSNSIFINVLSFGMCGSLIILGYDYLNYNLYSSNFINILILVFYRIISYTLLSLVGYLTFNQKFLISGIYTSIICNIIYGIVLYFIIKFLSERTNLKIVK